jgi:hypothetical protein
MEEYMMKVEAKVVMEVKVEVKVGREAQAEGGFL